VTPRDEPLLLIDVHVLFRRNGDARPTGHRLGSLTLSDADRYEWRLRLAEAFDGVATELRRAHRRVLEEDD
jgi:hypothetical protein